MLRCIARPASSGPVSQTRWPHATAAGAGPRLLGLGNDSLPNSQVRADSNRSELQRSIAEVRADSTSDDSDVTYDSEEDCE